jgi:hypothetical protein
MNCANRRRPTSTKTSLFRGVSRTKRGKKWQACLVYDKRTIFLGRFASEAEAALVYDAAVREKVGEFGIYNFPRDGERSAVVGNENDRQSA